MRVIDVFCAVSLSGTMRSAISVLPASVMFLVLTPWAAIFSMAKSSSAERTIPVARIPVCTWGSRQKVLWCVELVSMFFVGVKCAQKLLFCSSKGPNIKDCHDGYGPFLRTTIPRKKKPSIPKTE